MKKIKNALKKAIKRFLAPIVREIVREELNATVRVSIETASKVLRECQISQAEKSGDSCQSERNSRDNLN
jgi:DNA-directed RNA polymerase specialized sigma subunit